jgi:hypothetical protein
MSPALSRNLLAKPKYSKTNNQPLVRATCEHV